jgi:hypothetical protein
LPLRYEFLIVHLEFFRYRLNQSAATSSLLSAGRGPSFGTVRDR